MPFKKADKNINRKGAPKKDWTWGSLIRQALDELDDKGVPIKKSVSSALVLKALTGDVQAIKEIGNRIDGMPKQSTDITSGGDKIQTNTIVFENFKDASKNK